MATKPKAVAFDIIGTVFSLESLRPRMTVLGLPAHALEIWFASGLRDAFAIAASGEFQPFKEVLKGALQGVAAEHGVTLDESRIEGVLGGMTQLDAYPDARQAFETLRQAEIPILAVSNGAASSTRALLDRSGLATMVNAVVSVDDVKASKPRREVYLYAADMAAVEPGELALVASHPWDVNGAKLAGLRGVYVSRGNPYPAAMHQPDVSAGSLLDAVKLLTQSALARALHL